MISAQWSPYVPDFTGETKAASWIVKTAGDGGRRGWSGLEAEFQTARTTWGKPKKLWGPALLQSNYNILCSVCLSFIGGRFFFLSWDRVCTQAGFKITSLQLQPPEGCFVFRHVQLGPAQCRVISNWEMQRLQGWKIICSFLWGQTWSLHRFPIYCFFPVLFFRNGISTASELSLPLSLRFTFPALYK